jgi:hypothetical protein
LRQTHMVSSSAARAWAACSSCLRFMTRPEPWRGCRPRDAAKCISDIAL